MKKKIKVIKIEENLVYLEFSDKIVKKYLRENFLKEPSIGQEVQILDNGLIVDKQVQVVKGEHKVPDPEVQKIAVLLLGLYAIFFLVNTLGKLNIFAEDNSLNAIISVYILITLIIMTIYAHHVNSKALKILLIILVTIPVILVILYGLFFFFTLVWTFVACITCFGG